MVKSLIHLLTLLVVVLHGTTFAQPKNFSGEFTKDTVFLGCFQAGPEDDWGDWGIRRVAIISYEDSTLVTLSCAEIPDFQRTFLLQKDSSLLHTISAEFWSIVQLADTVTSRSLQVASNAPISCFGFIEGSVLESFNFIPLSSAGSDFRVITYPSFYLKDGVYKGAAQVSILAFSDTDIEVILRGNTLSGARHGDTLRRFLRMGEVFSFASDSASAHSDLSGTLIRTTNKVSVLVGNSYAAVPHLISPGWTSGINVLCESLPAIQHYSKRYLLNPLYNDSVPDVYRIVSMRNNTYITCADTSLMLNDAEFADLNIIGPAYLTASQPVLVGQFIYGARDGADTIRKISFSIVPSLDQLSGSLDFYVLQDTNRLNELLVANWHAVKLVTNSAGVADILLDGQPLDVSGFKSAGHLDGVEYFTGEVLLSGGRHKLRTISPSIGLAGIVHGHGQARHGYSYPIGRMYQPALGSGSSVSITANPGPSPAVFPNPTTNTVRIYTGGSRLTSWTVRDVLGRILRESDEVPSTFVVDVSLSGLASGRYSMECVFDSKTTIHALVIQ